MKNKEMFQYLTADDVPDQYQHIVELIGLDAFMKLCEYSCGDEIYFPMPDTILKVTRNRMILKEYNGYNTKELSTKYNLTLHQVKNITKGSQNRL